MSVAILMPVFDEEGRLAPTLASIRAVAGGFGGGVTVFVVDDGSSVPVDPRHLPAPDASFGIVLARHPINLGQGAAIETARQLALRHEACDVFVTMDADGQHRAEDAVALVHAVRAGADVAFGNRFLGGSHVPAARRLLLLGARLFERGLTGLRLADAHNGLRGFSRVALEQLPIRQNRMAHATEIKQRVARVARDRRLRLVEVPVTVRYAHETSQKGQRATGAAAILRDLLDQYLFGELP